MDTSLILRAIEVAAIAHAGQSRRYHNPPTPYIVHPIRCVRRLWEYHDRDLHLSRARGFWGAASPQLCVMALHDVLEDCDFPTAVMIGDEFGQQVLDGVQALTNPSKGSTAPRDERKAMDRAHIAKADRRWKVCKLIDRLDNIEDMAACITPPGIFWDGKLQLVKFANERYIPETRLLVDAIDKADHGLAARVMAACDALQAKCDPFIIRCDE